MSTLTHHIPDPLITAYAAGSLPHAFSVVVAAHISMCDECRVRLGAQEAVGGVVLEEQSNCAVSQGLKTQVLDMLDAPVAPEPEYTRRGVFPAPVMAELQGADPKWRPLGMGVKQSILSSGPGGSVRLISIPPGQAIPDHSHGGLELTLVLQGSFSDESGRFGVGDVEVADEDIDHIPIAGLEDTCVCLAATDEPLKFKGLMPRLLQPIIGI